MLITFLAKAILATMFKKIPGIFLDQFSCKLKKPQQHTVVGDKSNTMKTTFYLSLNCLQAFLNYKFKSNQREAFYNRYLLFVSMFMCIYDVSKLNKIEIEIESRLYCQI